MDKLTIFNYMNNILAVCDFNTASLLSTTRFAVLPAFIEPVCFSMPITFAPLMVAACKASKGVKPDN